MANLSTQNPFDKTKQLPAWTMYEVLKTGRNVPIDAVSTKLGHQVSNRTIGVFLRGAEDVGLRFTKSNDPEKGIMYRMYEGDTSMPRISVPFQNYLNGKQGTAKATKKAMTKRPSKKTAKSKTETSPITMKKPKTKAVSKKKKRVLQRG
jgi:hypothetical protein